MSSFILGMFSLLVFVFNIPGTIALRNVLSVLLLLLLVVVWLKKKAETAHLTSNSLFNAVILILLILTLYIFFHSLYVSHDPNWSLGEFKSHWFYPVIYLFIGILLAFITKLKSGFSKESLITFLFLVIFSHILYVDMVTLDRFIVSDIVIRRYGGLTQSPVLASYLTNVLIAMIFSEAIYRIRTGNSVLKISNNILAMIFVLSLTSVMIESMRFGVLTLFSLGMAAIFFLFIGNDKISKTLKWIYSAIILLVLSIPIVHSVSTDSRWNSLVETVLIAYDTESNLNWADHSLAAPKLSNGQNVDASNYWRVSWAFKAIEYIKDNPIGIGYGRNSFGHAIQINEGIDSARGKHAHSSILSFTIGIGIVGLALWLSFVVFLLVLSVKKFALNYSYFAINLFFLVSGFFFRSVVDGNMKDHMFQQFMLMLGIYLALLVYENIESRSS